MTAFADRPGAVASDGVVWHFGDPMREQRALAAGSAFAPLGDRAVVQVSGADRLSWLDSITSQAVAHLAPGESTELLILDPQGHVEHAAGILDDGASTWLITDAADAASLAVWLSRMVFRAQVTVTPRPELLVIGFVPGGSAHEAMRGAVSAPAGIPLIWNDPWTAVQPGGHQYAQLAEHPGAEHLWSLALLEEADAPGDVAIAGVLAAEALRIAAWRPRWTGEVDERSLPHESDWLRSAVHLSKGCYRGQETVAKVHNLGHPPRRLAALHLDGAASVLPERGDLVLREETEVGRITSAARHFEQGPIALAILSRRAPLGDLIVRTAEGDVAAAQQVIVPPDAGATANVPRLTRLSRRPAASDAPRR